MWSTSLLKTIALAAALCASAGVAFSSTLTQTLSGSSGSLPTDVYDTYVGPGDPESRIAAFDARYSTIEYVTGYDELRYGPLASVLIEYDIRYEITGDFDHATMDVDVHFTNYNTGGNLNIGSPSGIGSLLVTDPLELSVFSNDWRSPDREFYFRGGGGATAFGRLVEADFYIFYDLRLTYAPVQAIPLPASGTLLLGVLGLVLVGRRFALRTA